MPLGVQKISGANQSQAEQILDVLKRSIIQLCTKDHNGSEEILKQWLSNKTTENCLNWIADNNTVVLVALSSDKVVGVGKIDISGYLHHCYVDPEHICQGYGAALLTALEDQARVWNLDGIKLESTLTARNFYESKGYS